MHLLINLSLRDVSLRMVTMVVMSLLLLSKSWGSGGGSVGCSDYILKKRWYGIRRNRLNLFVIV
jgi:hypothetical protein